MDFFLLQKEMEKEMKILMGKNLDIFNFFLVEIIQVEKKPGRSKDFFPLKKEMVSFQKEMEKEMKILLGKKSGHLQVFSLVEIIQVEKKTCSGREKFSYESLKKLINNIFIYICINIYLEIIYNI